MLDYNGLQNDLTAVYFLSKHQRVLTLRTTLSFSTITTHAISHEKYLHACCSSFTGQKHESIYPTKISVQRVSLN